MRNAVILAVLSGALVLFQSCGIQATREAPAGVSANEAMAMDLAQALVSRDFGAARNNFDDRMKNALSEEKLEEVWIQTTGPLGAFKDFGPAYVEYVKTSPCVFIPCNFESGGIVVQVTQDSHGAVVEGLFLRPRGFSFL